MLDAPVIGPKGNISGILLAGGGGERLHGQDKGLLQISADAAPARSLCEQALQRLRPQVASIVISANRNIDWYQRFGWRVAADDEFAGAGPLAGVLAAGTGVAAEWLLVAPVDAPHLALNLASRLAAGLALRPAALEPRQLLACPHDGERTQQAFLLLNSCLLGSIRQYLQQGGRSVHGWLADHDPVLVDFEDQPEAFANINTPADLARFASSP